MTATRNFGRPWTPAEDEVLRTEYGRTPVGQLVVRLAGRTKEAIEHRASRLNVSGPCRIPWTAAEKAVLADLSRVGTPIPEIVRRLPGRSYPGVSRALHHFSRKSPSYQATRQYGLSSRGVRRPGVLVALALLRGPQTAREIARETGRDVYGVYGSLKAMRKNGLAFRVAGGPGRTPAMYALTPHALDLIADAGKEAADGRP